MAAQPNRIIPPMKELFRRDADIPETPITIVEGGSFDNPPSIKLLMVTPDMHCLKVYRKKGFVDPRHTHEDHTTVCCLLYGKLRLHIGEQRSIIFRSLLRIVEQTGAQNRMGRIQIAARHG